MPPPRPPRHRPLAIARARARSGPLMRTTKRLTYSPPSFIDDPIANTKTPRHSEKKVRDEVEAEVGADAEVEAEAVANDEEDEEEDDGFHMHPPDVTHLLLSSRTASGTQLNRREPPGRKTSSDWSLLQRCPMRLRRLHAGRSRGRRSLSERTAPLEMAVARRPSRSPARLPRSAAWLLTRTRHRYRHRHSQD